MKRTFRLLLLFMLMLTCLCVKAEAAATSGSCGEDLTWRFEESTGTLTISGTGEMWNFDDYLGDSYVIAPWRKLWGSIQSVVLEEGMTTIGSEAFCGLDISNISIPNSVTTIERDAFLECLFLNNVTIPSNVTELGVGVFWGCESLANVTLSEGLRIIGQSCFFDCPALVNITIPDSVTEIGRYAFKNCDSLTTIAMGDHVAFIGEGIFQSCGALLSVTLPDSLKSIPKYAFANCTSLQNLKVPNAVVNIDEYAFQECSSLESISIPGSVTDIVTSAFEGCNELAEISVAASNKKYRSVDGVLFNKALTRVVRYPQGIQGPYVIPESVTAIGSYSFSGCRGLTAVTIPDTVTSLAKYAFSQCDALTEVTVPGSISSIASYSFYHCDRLERATISEGVSVIGSFAFSNCVSMTDLSLPGTVTNMGEWSFYYCSALKNVAFGEGFGCIGEGAFVDCDSLTSITIPSSVRYVRLNAFWSCDSLQEVVILTNETSIAYGTFRDCRALTAITIPGSVKNIARYAFENCTSLKDVYYPLSQRQREKISFDAGNSSIKNATWHYGEVEELIAPTIGISIEKFTGKPVVSWNAVYGADFYRIYRATSSTGTYSYHKSTRSASYTDTTAVAGKNYYYKVRAVVEATEERSPYSNAVNRMCDLPMPKISMSLKEATGKPVVKWETVEGAVKYRIYRSTRKNGVYERVYSAVKARSFTDETAKVGTTYYYKVKAIHEKDSANSVYSAVKDCICHLPRPEVTIALKDGKPRLTWEKISGAEKYEIYRNTTKDGYYSKIKTTVTATSFTDTTAKAGKKYYYKVVAIHSKPEAISGSSTVKSITAK